MRLTDDVLRLSDDLHAELVSHALLLGAAGRFGLLPAKRPFSISLNFNKNIVEVVELNCLGVTRGHQLLDITFDSRYTQTGDLRVNIPAQDEKTAFLLLVAASDKFCDIGGNICESEWKISLIEENTPVPDDALPLARIVYDMGWREDNVDFLPPCMFLSSLATYMELANGFSDLLEKLDCVVYEKLQTDSGQARLVLWPMIKRLHIVMENEKDTMSPLTFLTKIQECISAIHCAFILDDCLELSEADKCAEFARIHFDFKNCYRNIVYGIDLLEIKYKKLKESALETPRVKDVTSPWIEKSELHFLATSNDVRFKVMGLDPGATGYYSLDDAEPTIPLQNGQFVPINPQFNRTRTNENDRSYVLKLKASLDGRSSKVSTFNLTVSKNVKVWNGWKI